MKKKVLALLLACVMVMGLTACGGNNSSGKGKYVVGISQYVTHPALDAATQGFIDAMNEKLGEDGWEYDLQNAAEDNPHLRHHRQLLRVQEG